MTRTDAVVLVTGIVGVTAIAIAKIIVDKRNTQKLTEQKDAFQSSHKIDDMIDNASVANDKLRAAEDKAIAKDLMIKSKNSLEESNTLDSFKINSDKFLKLYSDLTDGDTDKVKANLLYFKRMAEESDREADRKALEAYQSKMIDRSYQHDLDKLREGRMLLEAVLPDKYTFGKIVRGVIDKPKEEVNSTNS